PARGPALRRSLRHDASSPPTRPHRPRGGQGALGRAPRPHPTAEGVSPCGGTSKPSRNAYDTPSTGATWPAEAPATRLSPRRRCASLALEQRQPREAARDNRTPRPRRSLRPGRGRPALGGPLVGHPAAAPVRSGVRGTRERGRIDDAGGGALL